VTAFESLKTDAAGLVPAVVQDADSGRVLMVAWMNGEAWRKTLETRRAHFWSRSRGELWEKGATSGHTQDVVAVSLDCDSDTVLVSVRPAGPACHTGSASCFFTPVGEVTSSPPRGLQALAWLEALIARRKKEPEDGSYTNKLFAQGLDRILKKVGEESAEVLIAAKNRSKPELVAESADLVYHWLVLLAEQDVALDDVCRELAERHGKPRRQA
jgi:phosphoribosyl-ATP pyrophosphohydrolase/phosphoribosyl-AMP cyclohydrolase